MGLITDLLMGKPKSPPTELEARRIIVSNEPLPTPRQEVKTWMNEGTIPSKVVRMDEKMGEVFARVKKFKENPRDSQFIHKRGRTFGDPNNIDEMFGANDIFSIKQNRRKR